MKPPILMHGFLLRNENYQEIKDIDSRLHAWLHESDTQLYIDTDDHMYYLREDIKKAEETRQYWDDKRKEAEKDEVINKPFDHKILKGPEFFDYVWGDEEVKAAIRKKHGYA